jgi:DsbE subfamily thiol:disulfide oxidoreductase
MALIAFLAARLALIDQGEAPEKIPSVLIGKPAPNFSLPSLFDDKRVVANADLMGKVTLVNVFASWCLPCQAEHPLLAKIRSTGIALVGISYENDPAEARAWLAKMGNPYNEVGIDRDGRAAIDFGTYGVPESYLVDKQSVIRFKQTGPLTPDDIDNKILPLAKELQK